MRHAYIDMRHAQCSTPRLPRSPRSGGRGAWRDSAGGARPVSPESIGASFLGRRMSVGAQRRIHVAFVAVVISLLMSGCGSSSEQKAPTVPVNLQVNGDKAITRSLEAPVLLRDRTEASTVYMFGV